MKKLIGLFLGLTLLLSACGVDWGLGTNDDRAFVPAAYGENGRCYYEQDIDEALALQRAGLCPMNWVPTLMPPYWLAMYAPYYHSPAYIEVYVPAPRRTTFRARSSAWEQTHVNDIATARDRARWVDTKTRKPVSGTRIDYTTASFGSGSLRSKGFSSGSLRKPGGFTFKETKVNTSGFKPSSGSFFKPPSFSSPSRPTSTPTFRR